MIVFTFDDNNASNELAAKRLYEMRVKGIFLLNDGDDLEKQCEILKKYNHIIGNHTRSHRNMSNFTEEDFEYEVVDFQRKLEQYAGKVTWFSYPYSQRPNEKLMKKLKELFPNILRGVDNMDNPENETGDILRIPAKLWDFKGDIILQLHGITGDKEWDINNDLWEKICKQHLSSQS